MNTLLLIYCVVGVAALYFYSMYYFIEMPSYQYLEGAALIVAWPLTAAILFMKHLYKGIIKIFKD